MSDPTILALPREMILASAGSGKTFRISSRIIGLLAHGEPPESILASTFTRKAAGEILSRVLVRLAEAALDEEKAAELAEHAALAAGEPVDLDTDRCLALLRDLVRRLHRLNIGTLDAFFIRGAQAFAHEIGLPPAWSIADEPTARRALSEALQEVLRQGDPGTTVELVRLAQRGQAGRSVHDRLLGRLDVLHAIHHQLDPAVPDPWSLYPGLARDENGSKARGGGGTEAAPHAGDSARAMRERLADRIASLEAPRNASGSPNKTWAKALASATEAIRVGDWDAFVAQTLTQRIINGEGEYSRLPVPDDVAEVYEEAVEEAVRVIGRRLNAEAGALGRLVALFDSALERVQRREGAYRFGDVTRLLGGSSPLGTRPDLNYRLDAGMRHLLLDEFQDTSIPQWSALRPVADALLGTPDAVTMASGPGAAQLANAGSEANRAAIIVADPKQSIYGWRGAEPSLVYDVGRRYGLDDDVLAMSWRSSQVVLDAVNQVFEGIESSEVLDEPGRETAADWARAFAPHRAARDLPGHVRILVGPDDETRGQHRPLLLARAARLVRELREEAPGHGIGVLTRQNRAVAHLIHELKRLGVEASEEGGNPLTDSAAVVSVLALLRLADHPDDRIARYHVARTSVGAMVDFSDPADDAAARRLAHRIRERLLHDGYGDTLADWADVLVRACAPRDARRLHQLVELAFRYDARATLRPMDFVRWVEAERVEDPTAADVRVMTIHQSKGLEFDIVVLPELDVPFFRGGGEEALPFRETPTGPYTRVFPYAPSGIRPLFPEIEEAYRQHRAAVLRDGLSALYVAMTRARHELHIILKPDGKSGPGTAMTPARIVREALAPGAPAHPDDVLFESEDPGWKKAKAQAKAEGVVERGESVVEGEVVGEGEVVRGIAAPGRSAPLLRAQPRRLRLLPHRAPSGLGRGTRVDLAERLRIDTAPSLERGSVIHAWCERIEWLDDALPGGGLPEAETLRRDAKRIAPRMPTGEVDELIARFREWTARTEVRATLRREAYPAEARLERELPFLHRSGDTILEGIIDRLVVWDDGAEVIDFKSDVVDPGDEAGLEQLVGIYAPQLEAYREAVAGIFGLPGDAVRAKLVFLRAGAVRGVDGP